MHDGLTFGPVDEVRATGGSRIAHVAKRYTRVDRFLLCIVVAIKKLVNTKLRDSKKAQNKEDADQALLHVEVIDNTSTVTEENIGLGFFFFGLLLLCF